MSILIEKKFCMFTHSRIYFIRFKMEAEESVVGVGSPFAWMKSNDNCPHTSNDSGYSSGIFVSPEAKNTSLKQVNVKPRVR